MQSDTHPTTGEAIPVERADDDVSWLEALPISYRYFRAAGVMALGAASWLAWMQRTVGSFRQTESLWIVVILAVGGWRIHRWVTRETVRKYQTSTRPLTKIGLIARIRVLLAIGIGLLAVMLIFIVNGGEHPIVLYRMGAMSTPFLLAALLTYTFFRTTTALTPAAVAVKKLNDSVEQKPH